MNVFSYSNGCQKNRIKKKHYGYTSWVSSPSRIIKSVLELLLKYKVGDITL